MMTGAADLPPEPPGPEGPVDGVVTVTRSGGFAGLTRTAEVDLRGLDEPARQAWRSALSGELSACARTPVTPDGFVYQVHSDTAGLDLTVGEHALPDHLRSLLAQALAAPP